jgi:hypothetical protein
VNGPSERRPGRGVEVQAVTNLELCEIPRSRYPTRRYDDERQGGQEDPYPPRRDDDRSRLPEGGGGSWLCGPAYSPSQ